MRFYVFAAISIVSAALSAAPAYAVAQGTVYVHEAGYSEESGVSITHSTFAKLTTATASITAGPTLTAHGAQSALAGYSSAYAILDYSFTINVPGFVAPAQTGAEQTFYVPLLLTFAGGVSSTGLADSSVASTNLRLNELGGDIFGTGPAFEHSASCASNQPTCGGFGGTEALSVLYYWDNGVDTPTFGSTGRIHMQVNASAGSGIPQGAVADAWLDPQLAFSSAFLELYPDATITFEDVEVAPVPEPGEWAMIVAGLGIVAGAARRRRRA